MQVAGLTVQQEGRNLGNRNLLDVAPFDLSDNGGTANLSLYLNAAEPTSAATNVRLTFLQPNAAFGGLSYFGNGGEGATLDIFNGSTLLGSIEFGNGAGEFHGYLLTGGESATSVLLRSTRMMPGLAGEGLTLDDLAGVNASPVPEPGTVGFGLALCAAVLRRPKRSRF